MNFKFNKDELKESLTIEQVFEFVTEIGGEPIMDKSGTFFISKTICHNKIGEGSHKLYYYDNTHLFRCYTDCGESFDIYELLRKVKVIAGFDFTLPQAISVIANYFGFSAIEESFDEMQENAEDWELINKYNKINGYEKKEQIIELREFDDSFLSNLPRPRIESWEKEGISADVMLHRGICYDPMQCGIVIPHYNIDGKLIGIRERTLIAEEEQYGKYKPAIFNRRMYNHPLGFNLYNLNNSKKAIKLIQKAIVFEGEKSTLLYASYFGEDNDISVASCGSALINYQVKLLLSLGVKEIIVGFDKQFKELGDDEWKRWTKKLKDINTKYSRECQISFLFDTENLLGYKDSPIDRGPEVFMELFKRRIIL